MTTSPDPRATPPCNFCGKPSVGPSRNVAGAMRFTCSTACCVAIEEREGVVPPFGLSAADLGHPHPTLIHSVPVRRELLHKRERNPNHMSRADFARLRANILRAGFLQPLLVRPVPRADRELRQHYEVVDGAHRLDASDPEYAEVPCVVKEMSDAEAAAVQVAMGRLRGELDLAEVAAAVEQLSAAGWSPEDLSLTGYSPSELDDLLRVAEVREEDALAGVGGPAPDPSGQADDAPPKPFTLELSFSSSAELKRVKRFLRRAAGRGRDLSDGLLQLVDGGEA